MSSSSTPSTKPVLPKYFTGTDIFEMQRSTFVGAQYEHHVAAKVLVDSSGITAIKTGVWEYDSVSERFTTYIAADSEQKAIHLAGVLNACHGAQGKLTYKALKQAQEETTRQREQITTLEADAALAKRAMEGAVVLVPSGLGANLLAPKSMDPRRAKEIVVESARAIERGSFNSFGDLDDSISRLGDAMLRAVGGPRSPLTRPRW